MAKNLDLSGIDFSEQNQPQAQEAPGLDLSDIDLGDDVAPTSAPKAEPEAEDSWGNVVWKSLSAMPERMQRSWAGLQQAIAPAFNNTDVDAQAESLIAAAQQGVESANAKLAELGFNPNDMGFINKGKLRQALAFDNVKDDENFKAARDEGIRLSAEIAKTAPKTGEQWSPKNLVSTILTGAQDMAPSVALGLITKSPGLGLAEMSGQAYGSYYQDSIDKGMKPAEANNRASLFAVLEPVTEALPMSFLLKPGGKGLTDLGKTAVAEGLQESFTQAAQDAYDIGVLDEDMTVGQFLNNMAFSGVTGAGVGGTLHGTIHGPGMVKEALNNRAVSNAAAGAAAESGQAVPTVDPAEYDAVSAEMGGDALDRMTEQAVPEISAARRQAYADARAAGLSPADALTQARGQDAGTDLLDQMVQDVFDSPDSVYYANKQSAVNPPQSVADMVSQQAAQGDMGPVTGEMLGLPAPGQTSIIAMPGPIAPQAEPTGMRLTDTRDESRAPGRTLDISDINFDTVDAALPNTAELPPVPPSSNTAEGGTTSIAKDGMDLVHGSNNAGLNLDNIQIVRQEGQKQGKKGRVYGGFYNTSLEDSAQAEGYSKMGEGTPTMYDVRIKPGTKVFTKEGDITRLSESYINDLVGKGYGVVVGKDPRGRTEYAVIDKNAVESMKSRSEQAQQSLPQEQVELPPVPPAAQAELPPVPPSRAAELFGRKKKAAPVEEVDTEALAAEEARQADLKQKGDEAVARLEQRADLPALPGKKPAPLKVTRELVAAAKERGVEPGNKVNWNGKQYDVDKLQGRAVRLIDENGNGHIADIREVNAPEQQQAPKQALDVSDIDFTSDNMIEPGSDVDTRAEAWSKTIDAMSLSEANDLADDVGIKRRPNVDVKAQLKNVHPDDLDASASPKQEMEVEQQSILPQDVGAFERSPEVKKGIEAQQAEAAQLIKDGAKLVRDENGKRYVEMPDGTRTPTNEVGLYLTQALRRAKAEEVQKSTEEAKAAPTELPEFDRQVHENTLNDLLKQVDNTKRPLSKLREDMAAMQKQVDNPDLYGPVAGKTRAAIRKELEARKASISKPAATETAQAKPEPTSSKPAKNEKPSGAASIKESKPASKGMTPEQVAEIATEFVKNFKGVQSVDMSVMSRQADLGIDIPDGSSLLGFYEPGKISAKLIAENLSTREEVEALLRHEMIVHYGMRARLSKQEYDAEMDKVLAAEDSRTLRPFFEEARAKYDDFYDISSPDGQRMVAEEVVARVAEDPKALEKSGVIRRVIEAIRQLLIKAKILPNNASMESVRQLIQANGEYLKNTTVDRNDVRVSLPPMSYNAPRDMAPAMNKKTDIDDAQVPDDIKDGMRDTMYRDTRSFTQRIKDMMADNFSISGIYQGAFDDLHAIARYEKMSNNGQLKMGRESAYKFSMLAKNINSVVAVAMNKGAPVYDNGAIGVDKNTKGFTEIFKPVMELKGNMLPVWEYWAGAVRAKRLLAEGREQLYTEKQINDIIDYVNRRPELRKAFNEAHKDWRALNKAVLDFGEATGIVDPEARKLFESDDYVPFYRVDEEADKASGPTGKRGLANQSSGIRKLKGGEGKLDILENMARNVNHIISSGFKNAAMQRVKDVAIGAAIEPVPTNFKPVGISNDAIKKALNDMGVATSGMSSQQLKGYTNLFTAVAPAGPNVITIRYDGKPQYFEVTDPQLMRSITGIGPERLHAILKILAIPKKVLTRTVTSTPTFIATNMTRDIAGNFVQMAKETGRNTAPKVIADIMTLRPVYRAMAGAYKSITKHGQVTDYQVSGGMSGGYDQSRPEGVAKHLRNLHKKNVILDTPKKLWDAYETLLTASEQATRMAVYDDVLKNTGDPVEAAYQANDVMNFSRRGDNVLTHVLISTVPFLNARMQGLDRLARGAKDSPKAFLLKGAIITAATMSLMALNADDEDYWALPEYERDMFWVIPANGVRYRIPKPFEVGAVFGTIPERIFEATFRQDHMFKDRMGFMLANTFAVDLPQFVKPIYEDQANMNSFTQRPIVPMALQRVQPNQQYSTTSPEWIKGLAKMMPESAPEWMRSPLRLQHMIEGYTGSMGQYVVSTTDAMYSSLFTDKVMPAKREYDMPVIKAFVRGGESNDKYVDRLYQMSEKAGQFYGTLKAYKDQKMMEEYRTFKQENSSVLAARRNIDKSVARMQKLNKQTKAIYANDNMTPEAKREALDKLTVQKNELAKEVSDKYWMLF